MCTQSFASYIHSIEFEVGRRNGSKSEEEGTVGWGGGGSGRGGFIVKCLKLEALKLAQKRQKNIFKNPKLF